jgi:hypothetical protein
MHFSEEVFTNEDVSTTVPANTEVEEALVLMLNNFGRFRTVMDTLSLPSRAMIAQSV